MAKTAEYTKRAVDNYRNKFDMYQLRIPKDSGLKERMKKAYGKDMNNIILGLIETDLDRLEGKLINSAPAEEKQLMRSNTELHGQKNRPKKGEPIKIPSGFDNWPDEEKNAYMLEQTKAQYTPEEWEQLQREEKARRDKMLQDYQEHLNRNNRNQDQQKQISEDQNGENCPF